MSATIESRKCLVLNKGWSPVGTVTLQAAIIKLFSSYKNGDPKARIIDPESYQTFTWDDWSKLKPVCSDEAIRSANIAFRIPEIILLSRYDKLPNPRLHFSRRTLYKRDKMTCQYCGGKPGSEELTIDHVLPRSQGGGTSWENCVLACVDCNSRKANRTPQQANMMLAKQPTKPRMNLFSFDPLKKVKSWEAFLGEAFWEVNIENPPD